MTANKMTLRQVCFTLTAFTVSLKIISLPSHVAKFSQESLWISAIINFLLDGLMIFFILKISEKFDGLTFYQILDQNCGKAFTKTVFFLYFIYFFLKSYLPLNEQKNYIEIALYETTHVIWIFLPIFLVSAFFSYKGLKTVGRLSDLMIWFTAFSIIVLICLSLPASHFSNILPIIGVPFKSILTGSFRSLPWYFDSTYILFIIGNFKSEKLKKTKIMLSYVVGALVVIFFFIVLYGEFGPLTERQYYAPIKMGKYYLSTSNSGRIDYLAGFALAIVCVFSTTLPLVFSSLCLSHVFNFKHRITPCLIVNGLMAIIFFLTQNYFYVTFDILQKYIVFYLIALAYILPLILLFFKKGKNQL